MKIFFQLLCCFIFVLPLQAESFIIKSYDVQIKVSSEAYFDVIETIQVEFTEPRRGIFRNIPYRYKKDGKNIKAQIKDIKVDRWKSKVTSENGQKVIRIGDKDIYVEGLQEYVIRYRVYDAFVWAETHTEFYWNMVGYEWEVPIEELAFSVEFPKSLELQESEYVVYTGRAGSTNQDATIEYRGDNLFGKATTSLKPGEGLTVAAKLPMELIARPQASEIKAQEPKSFWQKNNLLGVPAALVAFLFGFWWKSGRNHGIKIDSEPVYYPPQGYSPAEMGKLIDGTAHNRDIISLLPWWAEQGIIKISNRPPEHPDGLDMRLTRLRDLEPDAPEYQHSIFNKLFKDNDTVYLNEFTNVFYGTMSTARSQINEFLKEQELYDRNAYRIFHSGWMILAGVLCFFGAIATMIALSQIFTGLFLIGLSVLAFCLHFTNPKLSEYGRDLMTQLMSFRQTIKNPDRDTVRQLVEKDPKYFEYVFPYALAFGYDTDWLKQTEGLFMAPVWYGYYGYEGSQYMGVNSTPSFQSFTKGFQPKEITQVFTSAPVSSSSSSSSSGGGFSGGGSSGGGFGGGGGGSW